MHCFLKIISIVISVFLLAACSSSNNGDVLPDVELDGVAPSSLGIEPPLNEDSIVNSNQDFIVNFDELLDDSSLKDGLSFYSLKGRDIYSTIILGSSSTVPVIADQRAFSYEVKNRLITVTEVIEEEEELTEEDADSDEVTAPEERVVERLATSVRVEPAERLALATSYAVEFDTTVKDVSLIESIGPNGQASTGNYLVEDIDFQFQTEDGTWLSAVPMNEFAHAGTNKSSAFSYIDVSEKGWVRWLQTEDVGGSVDQRIYSKEFDTTTGQFNNSTVRLDYIAAQDTIRTGFEGNVTQYSSARTGTSGSDLECTVWVNLDESVAPQTRSLLSRCGDQRPRVVLKQIIGGTALSDFSLHHEKDDTFLLSYIDNNILNVDVLELANGQLSVTGSQQFGSGLDQIIAADSIQSPDLDLGATLPFLSFVSELYSGGSVSGYEISAAAYSAGTFSRESIYMSANSLSKAEVGYDANGLAVAAWLEGAGSSTRLKVSRFNGFRWNGPVTINPTQGDITDKTLSVFEDGQSLFVWVEKGAATSFIKSQGYFPINGANAYSLVPVQTLDSLVGDYTGLQLAADREGNAHLAVSVLGSFLTTYRFLHNIEWNEAWSDAETLTNSSKPNVYQVEMIKKDGRSLMLYVNEALSYDRFYAQPFSDFE